MIFTTVYNEAFSSKNDLDDQNLLLATVHLSQNFTDDISLRDFEKIKRFCIQCYQTCSQRHVLLQLEI
jgi:hypothetical protein